MKNIYLSTILLCLGIVFFQNCNFNVKRGNGNIVLEEIDLENFSKVSIGGNYNVTLIEGIETKVNIETDENLMTFINTELYDQTLNINNVHNLKGSKGINIEIYYREIDKIYSTGASNIGHDDTLTGEELMINLSGAGAIDLELEIQKVKVNLTGAGVIKLAGQTDILETHISGAGGLSAIELISNECSINLSGLGGAEVYAKEKLEATITGIGGIIYAGNPKLVERQVTGLGKIKRADQYIDEKNM